MLNKILNMSDKKLYVIFYNVVLWFVFFYLKQFIPDKWDISDFTTWLLWFTFDFVHNLKSIIIWI